MAILRHTLLAALITTLTTLTTACATQSDLNRLETKIDRIATATNRASLDRIFGEQSQTLARQINSMDETQAQRFHELNQNYLSGNITLAEVREKMLGVLGSNDREVSADRGIFVRNLEGEKINALAQGTRINGSRLLDRDELPAAIRAQRSLQRLSWGVGEVNGLHVLFPWEFTVSSFTKEIAEHTAKRTAEEFMRMGGEKQWNRPIHIEVSVKDSARLDIATKDDSAEVYVLSEKQKHEFDRQQFEADSEREPM